MSERNMQLLVLAPTATDAALSDELFASAGVSCVFCRDMPAFSELIEAGIGAVLLTEESLAGENASQLAAILGRQPPWSDLPIIVLTRGGADSPVAAYALNALGNVTLLERPVRRLTLLSAVRSALRARARQYENARLIDQLKQADQRKDEFLAMLAHELRTPLAPIRNAAHLVQLAGSTAPSLVQAGSQIERQVSHLSRLVDDLLDVSRITLGKIQLQEEVVDLADVIAQAVETTRPLFDAKQHWLSVVLPPHPVRLDADRARLVQVFSNLLDNAAKYTDPGGRVRLNAEPDGANIVVRVQDSGVGIGADVLPHVFDPFTQAERSLDRAEGGLGIGLALVRTLVGLHGGRVAVRSEGPGRGSEFTVYLPKVSEPLALVPATTPPPPQLESRKHLRVLVVEDHPDAAESLRALLIFFGHEVTVVRSGTEGVAVAGQEAPDVVLCDIGLPGLDGYAVADAIRKNQRVAGTRLIAVTSYGREADLRRALQAGFDAHLTKPVDPEDLLNQLGRVQR